MLELPLRPNVCMLLHNQDSDLFLGERYGEAGVWQLPQGGVEAEYSVEENVLRELEEEIGVGRDLLEIEHCLDWRYEYEWETVPEHYRGKWRGQSQTFWVVKFSGKDQDIVLDRYTPEFMNWRWASPETVLCEAQALRLPAYQGALQEYSEWQKS